MAKKRLLIIEDDVDVSEMLTTYFESQGYEIFHAEEGAEGITLGRAKLPNLILLDVMLPDMDGFDVCKALRSTMLTKYIPITFLTQRDARADKIAGLELGADDYVTKPFDIEELRLRVQGSIRRATRDHLHEPRTGLPGGPMIDEVLKQLQGKTGWHHLDIGLNGFSSFREVYGFLTADEALSLTGHVLADVVTELGTANDFIGTPEEGRFVVFTHAEDAGKVINALTERFNERVKTLYNFADAERGYIVLKPGTDEERQEPLMTLKVVQAQPEEPKKAPSQE
jgi:CheY-like chemotaxis protein